MNALRGASPSQMSDLLASDARSIDALKSRAAQDPKGAIAATAKHLEALFMQELMKSMRQASMSSGMLDNEASEMGMQMLDQQRAMQMTGMPRGLSEAIMRQLERQMGVSVEDELPAQPLQPLRPWAGQGPQVHAMPPLQSPSPKNPRLEPQRLGSGSQGQLGFVQRHQEAAERAEAQTGIPASFMLAQAGHETGWGRKRITLPDGSDSHNLFGIKAGPGWKGPVATITTTEYVDGEPRKVQAKFRAYASNEEAFADYARLMKTSPRYSQVLAQAQSPEGFAQGLQKAGYATDPAYADKLGRAINTTLRLQRMLS